MKSVLAFDFGGTKLAAALLNPSTGQILNATRQPTPPSAQKSLEIIQEMATQLMNPPPRLTPDCIGVSFGGLVDPDGRTILKSHHIPGWEDFRLADILEETYHIPACVANDADAAALGEFHFGAGKGQRSLLYLTVSTGIGGGIILNGELYRGVHAQAGEIGHMVLNPDGPLCPCGRNGCLEALASGRSISREIRHRLLEIPRSAIRSKWPADLNLITAKQVAEAARSGDPLAHEIWFTAMRWLGIGIANTVNLLDPGLVVIGGGLSLAGELFFKPLEHAVRQYALIPDLDIVPAALGDSVNLLGAAVLASQAYDPPV